MIRLTVEQIVFLLECIRQQCGPSFGYSRNKQIGALQASLSIALEMAARSDYHSDPIKIPKTPER